MSPTLTPTRERGTIIRRPTGIVLAVPNVQQSELIERVLKRMGWNAMLARTATEVRQLLVENPGSIAILGPDLGDESGWLTCAKLARPFGRTTVLMVGADTPHNRLMARGAGAVTLLTDPVAIADWLPPRATLRN